MKTLANILWFVLSGVWMAIGYVVAGVLSIVFIITIPLAVPAFKMAGYALWPFGRAVVKRQDSRPGLRTLGNLVWFVIAGWWLALGHLITGVLLCLTVIGIPFGIVSFRLAGLAFLPYGKEIVDIASPRAADAVVAMPAAAT